MINQKLLVSGADYFSDEFEINPYYTSNKINVAKAMAEHQTIVDCFKKADIEIIKAREQLEKLGIKTLLAPGNHLYSGQGDSLICGKYLFGGRGYRSDPESQQFAAETFGLELVQVHAKPQLNPDGTEHINPFTNHADSFWYDLDLAISVIDEHTIAYCPEALDEESNQKIDAITDLDKIKVDFDECTKGFADNLVSTGKHVIMSNKAPKLQAELEKRGLICLTPDVTELKEGGGYIRCVSLWLS